MLTLYYIGSGTKSLFYFTLEMRSILLLSEINRKMRKDIVKANMHKLSIFHASQSYKALFKFDLIETSHISLKQILKFANAFK